MESPTGTHGSPAQSAGHLDYLDALRGYAITGVFLVHFLHDQDFAIKPPKILNFVGQGVTLFYVLSAYCLMLSLHRQGSGIRWIDYAIRRLFRIAPAFYCAIVLWSVIYLCGGHALDKTKLITSMTFVNGFLPSQIHSCIPHGWSIAVETSFYVILPFVFLRIRNFRQSLVALACAIPVCVTCSWILPELLNRLYPDGRFSEAGAYTVFWLPAQLPVFLLGVTTYFALHGPDVKQPWLSKITHGHSFLPLGLLVLAAIFAGYLPTRIAHIAVAFCCAGSLIWLSAHPRSWMVNRFMTRIGLISFSAYLFHQLGINLTKLAFPSAITATTGVPALCLAAGLTVLIAGISYRLVEKPGMALGSSLIRRRHPARTREENQAVARPQSAKIAD